MQYHGIILDATGTTYTVKEKKTEKKEQQKTKKQIEREKRNNNIKICCAFPQEMWQIIKKNRLEKKYHRTYPE